MPTERAERATPTGLGTIGSCEELRNNEEGGLKENAKWESRPTRADFRNFFLDFTIVLVNSTKSQKCYQFKFWIDTSNTLIFKILASTGRYDQYFKRYYVVDINLMIGRRNFRRSGCYQYGIKL